MLCWMRHFIVAITVDAALNKPQILWLKHWRLEWCFCIVRPILTINDELSNPVWNRYIRMHKSQLVFEYLEKVTMPRKELNCVVCVRDVVQVNLCPVIDNAFHFVVFCIGCHNCSTKQAPFLSTHVPKLFSYPDATGTFFSSYRVDCKNQCKYKQVHVFEFHKQYPFYIQLIYG